MSGTEQEFGEVVASKHGCFACACYSRKGTRIRDRKEDLGILRGNKQLSRLLEACEPLFSSAGVCVFLSWYRVSFFGFGEVQGKLLSVGTSQTLHLPVWCGRRPRKLIPSFLFTRDARHLFPSKHLLVDLFSVCTPWLSSKSNLPSFPENLHLCRLMVICFCYASAIGSQ